MSELEVRQRLMGRVARAMEAEITGQPVVPRDIERTVNRAVAKQYGKGVVNQVRVITTKGVTEVRIVNRYMPLFGILGGDKNLGNRARASIHVLELTNHTFKSLASFFVLGHGRTKLLNLGRKKHQLPSLELTEELGLLDFDCPVEQWLEVSRGCRVGKFLTRDWWTRLEVSVQI